MDKNKTLLTFPLIDGVIKFCSGAVMSVFLLRYLGVADYGTYAYILSILATGTIASRFGLINILVQELCDAKTAETREKIAAYMQIRFAFSVLCQCFAFIVILWSVPNISFLEGAFVSLYIVFTVHDIYEAYFLSHSDLTKISLTKTGATLVSLIAKLLLMVLGCPVSYFLALVVIEQAVLLLLIKGQYQQRLPKTTELRPTITLLPTLKRALPVAVSSILVVIYYRVDLYMLYNMAGDEAAGVYAISSRISESWVFVPTIVVAAMFPKILRKAKDVLTREDDTASIFALIYLMSVAFIMIILMLPDALYQFVLGESADSVVAVLIVHSWVSFFLVQGLVSSRWFIYKKLERYFVLRAAVGVALNVPLNYFCINEFGVIGAAWATLISIICANFVLNLIVPELRNLAWVQLKGFNIFRLPSVWRLTR